MNYLQNCWEGTKMIKKITFTPYNFIPSGNIDHSAIIGSFENIVRQLNEAIEDINLHESQRGIFTRSVLVEGKEPVELLEAGRYRNVKMLSGFITAGDNIKDLDNKIMLVDKKGRDLVAPKAIRAGEKSGKVHSLDIYPFKGTGKLDSAQVIPSSVRKVVVCVTFQEI